MPDPIPPQLAQLPFGSRIKTNHDRNQLRFAWGSFVVALAGTGLLLHPAFSGENEYFRSPKVLALGLAAALLGAWLGLRRELDARLTKFDLAIFTYLGAGILSWLLHWRNWAMSLSWLALEGGAVILLLAASRYVREKEGGRGQLLSLVVAVGILMAAVAVFEACGFRLPWVGLSRPYSTLNNRNFVGGYLAIALPVAVYWQLRRPLPGALPVFLIALVVCLCRCRSAWLGLICAAVGVGLVLLWLKRGGRSFQIHLERPSLVATAGTLALAIGVAAMFPWPGLRWREDRPLLSSLGRLLEYQEGSGRVRVNMHRVGLAILAAHPIFGVGPRQWEDGASEQARAVEGQHANTWFVTPTPHSDALRIASETGLVGFLALVAAALLLLRSALASLRRTESNPGPTLATLAALCVGLVHGLLDAPLFRPETLALIAVLAGTLRPTAVEGAFPLPRILARAIPIALGGLALTFGVLRVSSAVVGVQGRHTLESRELSLRLFPRVELAEGLAIDLIRRGRCDQAQPFLSQARTWSPHHWGPYYLAAVCAEKRNDWEEAQRNFEVALSFEPHVRELAKTMTRHGSSATFLKPDPPRQ